MKKTLLIQVRFSVQCHYYTDPIDIATVNDKKKLNKTGVKQVGTHES